ncbi:MAG: chloride channel protein [Gemmataceae bacterium]
MNFIRSLLLGGVLGSLVGVLAGTASAVFLLSLDAITALREDQGWLIYFLPVGGLLVGWLYHRFGQQSAAGNNLLIDEIHEPKSGIPPRMAPLILLTTLLTHLVGGSAGREGTAVQMGGGLAGTLGRLLRLRDLRVLLMAGISAGFGSVFGTPLAGLIFGLEVLHVGRMRTDALGPCLAGSLVGDWVCSAWGVKHTHYPIPEPLALSPLLIGQLILLAVAFGGIAWVFAEATHRLTALFRLIAWPPLRPVLGGVLLIGLITLVGTRDYLGLSLPLLTSSLSGEVVRWAFLWKLVFSVLTLSSGFKGGEVTPLFVIGATLGHSLGVLIGLPPGYAATLGFVAVFGAAANTPLACLMMGIELFGAAHAVPLAVVCIGAFLSSGTGGIYTAQRCEPIG